MGRPKLLLPWRGSTVIGHLISQWRELGSTQTAIVVRANDLALAAELDRLNFPKTDHIINPEPERGMFGSIVCAANWGGWQEEISHWAVVLGDQPHLQLQMLRGLLEFAGQNREAICQPEFGGRAGHPVILPQRVFAGLKGTNAATMKDFLKLAAGPSVLFPVTDPGLSLDLDTPDDYKRLQACI